MTWGIVATVAIGVVSGAMNSSKEKKAASKQAKYQSEQEAIAWKQNTADNEAIAEANLQNTIRTGFKVGMLNVQRGQAKKAMMAQGFGLSRNKQLAMGAVNANAAANGTIGASVDAVALDVGSKVGEAEAQLDSDYYQMSENFDTQLYDILKQGEDSLQSKLSINVQRQPKANVTGMGQVVTGALLQGLGMWGSSRMSLGTGSGGNTASYNTEMGRLNAQAAGGG